RDNTLERQVLNIRLIVQENRITTSIRIHVTGSHPGGVLVDVFSFAPGQTFTCSVHVFQTHGEHITESFSNMQAPSQCREYGRHIATDGESAKFSANFPLIA